MPRKKQGLRSYHHKSRNGCTSCKRRRVKCDAQAPVCRNCFRRNECCAYLDATSNHPNTPQWTSEVAIIGRSHTSNATYPVGSPFLFGSTSIPGQRNQNYAFGYTLPHTTPTSGTLEALCPTSVSMTSCLSLLLCNSWFSPYETSLWVPVLADQANKYRYVQHCFFSLSCLCRDRVSSTSDSPFTSIAAYEHQLAALSLFQQAPPRIDGENWMAVLTFEICMIIFQLSVQEFCPEGDFDYLETMRVLRSSMAINHEVLPYLRKSKHWPLIVQRTTIPKIPLSSKMLASLHRLDSLVSESLESDGMDHDEEERAEVNRQALEELQKWMVNCQGIPRTWKNYCEWPFAVNAEFIDLLAEGDDIALLIFIHWCAIMYMSQKRRFVTAWSKRAVTIAVRHLKRSWEDVLAWPLEMFTTMQDVSMRTLVLEKYKQHARNESAMTRGMDERGLEGAEIYAQIVM